MSWEAIDALNNGLESQPSQHKMLRRRVLTIDEFAREKSGSGVQPKAAYGSKYVPIPVPLALRETEQQYEDAFRAYTEEVTRRDFHEVVAEWGASKERQRRCTYAMLRLKEFKATHSRRKTTADTTETSVDDFEMPPRPGQKRAKVEKPEKPQRAERDPKEVEEKARRRRMELYAKLYVDLEEHRQAMREGYLNKIKEMTTEEKVREFGSAIVPIIVPLARGETREQYEERFIKWILDKHGLTLEALQNHPKETQERHYRMMFAQANTFGQAKFVAPRKRESDKADEDQRDETPRKKLKEDASPHHEKTDVEAAKTKEKQPRKASCAGQDTIASFMACGCRRCLVKGMRSLAKKITDAESTKREHEIASARVTHVVDLTSDTESLTSGYGSPGRSMPLKPAPIDVEDPIEMKLAAAYDSINEQIVMNEGVLEGSTTRLLDIPIVDIKETTLIQDEDQEMRELIRDEMKSRSEALAVLIVYLWRDEISALKKIADDPTATNVIHVQRASHHKCAQLATDIATKREVLAQLKSQLDSAAAEPSSDQNARLLTSSMLTALKTDVVAELKEILVRRRREFVRLVHFDQRIRHRSSAWKESMIRSRDDQLRAQRYVSFREFKQRRDDGWFARLHTMGRIDRIDRFGCAIPPIYGPLETWETPDQYENTFAEWLRSEYNVRIEVVRRQDPKQERSYRRQFAWDKLFRRDQRGHTKRPRENTVSDDYKPKKKSKRDDRAANRPPAPRLAAEAARTAPVKREPREENQQCSTTNENTSCSADAVTKHPVARKTREPATESTTVDLTLAAGITRMVLGRCAEAEAADQDLRLRGPGTDLALGDDPIEARLWTVYAAENERVLHLESALKMASGRLFCGFADAEEMQQLQHESDRLRVLLQASSERRSTAVALLVDYLCRREVDNIRLLIQQAAAHDSPIIQRANHRKCATWDAKIKTKQCEVAKMTQDLNAAMCCPDTSSTDPDLMERIANINDALISAEE